MANVVCVGDPSDHGGSVIDDGGSVALRAAGDVVAVDGALHACPIEGHGVTSITATTSQSRNAGKRILTSGSVAGCGAVINAPSRGMGVE